MYNFPQVFIWSPSFDMFWANRQVHPWTRQPKLARRYIWWLDQTPLKRALAQALQSSPDAVIAAHAPRAAIRALGLHQISLGYPRIPPVTNVVLGPLCGAYKITYFSPTETGDSYTPEITFTRIAHAVSMRGTHAPEWAAWCEINPASQDPEPT